MRKSLLSLVVGLGVVLAALTAEPAAYAQRRVSGGGSSGRSYSSGSSSTRTSGSSRTSSPSTRPSAPSRQSSPAPSRPSASGKSYSSGAHSVPAGSSPKKPSSPPSNPLAQKTTTTPPRQNFPANTKPRTSTFDEAAAAAQKKEQSRAAYTNKSTNPDTRPATGSTSPVVHPSGKTYAKNGYDAGAAQAQRREESRIAYEAGKAPKPSYRTPGGIEKPIEANAPEVQRVRRVVTPEVWRTRPARIDYVYRPYFGYPVIVYNDPYNGFFWYWLLSQSLDSQARWAYHHRYVMDQARYDALLNRNAELAARVSQLEQSKAPRDTTYTPSGIDPDLMYADDYVESAYNPQEVTAADATSPNMDFPTTTARNNRQLVHAWKIIWHGLFAIAATAAVTFFLIWLIFIKRWGGDRPAPGRARRHGRR